MSGLQTLLPESALVTMTSTKPKSPNAQRYVADEHGKLHPAGEA